MPSADEHIPQEDLERLYGLLDIALKQSNESQAMVTIQHAVNQFRFANDDVSRTCLRKLLEHGISVDGCRDLYRKYSNSPIAHLKQFARLTAIYCREHGVDLSSWASAQSLAPAQTIDPQDDVVEILLDENGVAVPVLGKEPKRRAADPHELLTVANVEAVPPSAPSLPLPTPVDISSKGRCRDCRFFIAATGADGSGDLCGVGWGRVKTPDGAIVEVAPGDMMLTGSTFLGTQTPARTHPEFRCLAFNHRICTPAPSADASVTQGQEEG